MALTAVLLAAALICGPAAPTASRPRGGPTATYVAPVGTGDPVLAWLMALAGELRGGSDPLRAIRVCGLRHR